MEIQSVVFLFSHHDKNLVHICHALISRLAMDLFRFSRRTLLHGVLLRYEQLELSVSHKNIKGRLKCSAHQHCLTSHNAGRDFKFETGGKNVT
jgi:hypothetical protein